MRGVWPRLLWAAVLVAPLAACGKKGPPLPPLLRVPAQIAEFSAVRAGDEVYLTLLVPTANVGRDTPADIGHVEIAAVTADVAPTPPDGDVRTPWTVIARAPVRRPVPPAPAAKPDVPPLPIEPGLDQGQRATFREVLTEEVRTAPEDVEPAPAAADDERPALSLPLVAGTPDRVRRYYAARAVSRSGRPGAWSTVRAVPTAPTLPPATAATPTYDASTMTVTWAPPPGAVTPPPPPVEEGLLPSRPFGPAAVTTTYNVYDGNAVAAVDGPFGTVARPAPLNPAPVDALSFAMPGVTFDVERCVVVRAVETIGGVPVEGPPSSPACVTPRDTFPPPAPTALAAIGGAGVISLIWDAVETDDLAGYLVFRGEVGGAAEAPLTASPIREASYEDRSVVPGVRYVYTVVAVDSAAPGNRSAPSNRAEETAR